MMTNLLLVVIALLLAALLFRERVHAAVTHATRRRPAVKPAASAPVPQTPQGSQLLLRGFDNEVEHEIGWHFGEPPDTYTYAGKTYTKYRRYDGKRSLHAHDDVWEYRR